MRIARWSHAGEVGEGFVVDGAVVPFGRGRTVAAALEAGLAAMPTWSDEADRAAATPLAEVVLLAPVVPASVRDFVTFEEHVEGVSAGVEGRSHVADEWYEAPTFYFTNPHTILGPGEPVTPPVTQRLDFELELAAVVGSAPGVGESNLTAAEGTAKIFGYTIMNDWSARDLQGREMKVRLGPAKGKDFAMSLGPWIVTADELDEYLDEDGFLALGAEVSVNGTAVGRDLVSNMGWPFGELVAYAARNSRVVPGDVLGSGTVGNGGCLAELWGRSGALTPSPLAPGDVVAMHIEGIGDLTACVGAYAPAPALPAARTRSRARVRTSEQKESR